MSKVQLITFDLDDTFWDIGPVIINAEMTTRKWLEEKVGEIEWGTLQSFLELRNQLAKNDESLNWDLGKLRREIFRVKLSPIISNSKELENLVNQAFDFFLNKRHEVVFYDGVIDALEALSKEYELGVLTNGNADIKRLGIDKYFNFSISSADVKSNKPEEGHFKKALSNSKLLPQEVIHVGDHQINDVTGALNAGMHAVWFNKDVAEWAQNYNQPTTFSDWYNYQKIEELSI